MIFLETLDNDYQRITSFFGYEFIAGSYLFFIFLYYVFYYEKFDLKKIYFFNIYIGIFFQATEHLL